MSIIASNVLAGASGQAASGYQVERSLRLNSADSAYLGRTFSAPTTQGTFTFAAWIKRAALGTTQHLFGVSTNHSFGFTSGNALNLTFAGSSALTTTALFRDPSAWYHIVWTQSGTSHTLYVNNVSVGTATATSSVFNTAVAHQIGAANTANYFSGYLADVHFIDGQALTPSSFTEVSATTGQLVPKAYTGTYGTNGFRLDFSDNSAATATTLGKDRAGSNNWTPNNLSVTAGSGNDSLVDTPTSYGTDTGAGGEVRGNYATWNPLSKDAGTTLSNGNLDLSSTDRGNNTATFFLTSGKWYWEGQGDGYVAAICGKAGQNWPDSISGTGSNSIGWWIDGPVFWDGGNNGGSTTYGSSDIVGTALDMDAGVVYFYKNGSLVYTITFGSGTVPNLSSGVFPCYNNGSISVTRSAVHNFGQRPFAYTAPSGFKALCDTNLPEGTITTSGTFTGNANADGPFIWLNGVPTAMTINSNAVTFGTHADKLANGFKVRSNSASYNTSGSNTYSITTTGDKFKYARAQSNP